MTVETAYNITQLDPALPEDTDILSEGAAAIRLVKQNLVNAFPGVAGPVTATHTELNYVDGVTSAIQTQLDAKAPLASPALTGTPTAPNPASGSNTTQIATMAAVNTAIAVARLTGTLPSIVGEGGKDLATDGTVIEWRNRFYKYVGRTSNTILAKSDHGTFLDITSGTFTQTFDTPANLGSSWAVRVRNSGTGVIGVTSDGVTYAMYPNEVRHFVSDGTTLRSVVVESFKFTPSASTSFIEPPGYSAFDTFILAPGGGGGAGRRGAAGGDRSGGGGGGGGTWVQALIPATTPGTSHTLTVGAAGVGGAAQTTNDTTGQSGTAGGNSSFGTLLIAPGGSGGAGGNTTVGTAGAAGAASLGHLTAQGTASGTGQEAAGGSTAGADASGWGATGGGGGNGIAGGGPVGGDGNAGGTSGTASSGTQIAGGTAGTGGGSGGNGNTPVNKRRGGTGGGSGGASATVNAGSGGNGAHGGGGGGGGAALNGLNSGAGGNGGAGYFEILGVA